MSETKKVRMSDSQGKRRRRRKSPQDELPAKAEPKKATKGSSKKKSTQSDTNGDGEQKLIREPKPLYMKKRNIEDVKPYRDGPGTTPPKELVIARRLMILHEYARGVSPETIAWELECKEEIVHREIEIALSSIAKDYSSLPPQQAFARYVVFQTNIINKLQRSYETLSQDTTAKAATAAISALKAQSDIYDKIFQKGMEFGVITQKVQRSSKTAQYLQSSPQELTIILEQEINQMLIMLDEIDPEATTKFKRLLQNPPQPASVKKQQALEAQPGTLLETDPLQSTKPNRSKPKKDDSDKEKTNESKPDKSPDVSWMFKQGAKASKTESEMTPQEIELQKEEELTQKLINAKQPPAEFSQSNKTNTPNQATGQEIQNFLIPPSKKEE